MLNDSFWILWAFTVLIFGWCIVRSLLKPVEMLGFPFIATFFGGYFYIYMAYQAAEHLSGVIPHEAMEQGQLVVILCYLGIYLGWYSNVKKNSVPSRASPKLNYRAMWKVGLFFCYLGAAGNYTFINFSSDGFNTSAYWYMLYQVAYPGAALCILGISRERKLQTMTIYVVTGIPILMVAMPYLIAARRGPTMAWLLVGLFGYVLAKGRAPSRTMMLLSLTAAGLLILTIFSGRRRLAEGESFTAVVRDTSLEEVTVNRTLSVADNEYAYHCAMIDTIVRSGKYQYGTSHAMLLLNAIPRSLWEGKPGRGEGLFPKAQDDITTYTGISMGSGMSAAGIADAFEQYGWFSPIFFLVFSRLLSAFFRRATEGDDWFWKVSWINIMACSHWLIAQGMAAFFVPMLFGQGVPVIASLRWLPRSPKRPKLKKSLGPPPQSLAQVAPPTT